MWWISDRQPEKSGTYLVTTKKGSMQVLDYSAKYGMWNAYDWDSLESAKEYAMEVSRWMEIPKED